MKTESLGTGKITLAAGMLEIGLHLPVGMRIIALDVNEHGQPVLTVESPDLPLDGIYPHYTIVIEKQPQFLWTLTNARSEVVATKLPARS